MTRAIALFCLAVAVAPACAEPRAEKARVDRQAAAAGRPGGDAGRHPRRPVEGDEGPRP